MCQNKCGLKWSLWLCPNWSGTNYLIGILMRPCLMRLRHKKYNVWFLFLFFAMFYVCSHPSATAVFMRAVAACVCGRCSDSNDECRVAFVHNGAVNSGPKRVKSRPPCRTVAPQQASTNEAADAGLRSPGLATNAATTVRPFASSRNSSRKWRRGSFISLEQPLIFKCHCTLKKQLCLRHVLYHSRPLSALRRNSPRVF